MPKIPILLLHVIIIVTMMTSQPTLAGEKSSSEAMYTESDDVIVLDADNFQDEVYNSTNSWFVMFYSRWCGHCKHFAPTYKRLATDMKGWGKHIKLAAVDCSAKSEKTSKDNGMKICFRKPYFVGGMPDCRLFPPFSDATTKGVSRKFLGKKTYGSDGKLKEDSDSYENVQNDIVNLLQDHHGDGVAMNLEFLKKKDMEKIIENFNKFVLIIEPRKSNVGKFITLDVAGEWEVKMGRVSNRNKKAIALLEQKFTVQIPNTETSALVIMTSSPKMLYSNQDPQDFRKRVVEEIRHHHQEQGEEEDVTSSEQGRDDAAAADVEKGVDDVVMMSQLEMALHYALRKEIAGKEVIKHRDLKNLKAFLNTIIQFFPGRKKTMKFVRKVRKLISSKDFVEWEDWQQVLRRAKHTVGSFLSSHEDYSESCSSFPCCFWQLLHVIMTQYYRTAPGMDPLIILRTMSGYMESFFTCQNCQENWKYETEDMEDFVDDAASAIIYLWKKHNAVNRRLGKKAWPAMSTCPACWDGQVFDLDEVERFLADFYHFEKISPRGAREEEDEEEEEDEDEEEVSAGGAGAKDEL